MGVAGELGEVAMVNWERQELPIPAYDSWGWPEGQKVMHEEPEFHSCSFKAEI